MRFVDVVCDGTDETSDSLTYESKPAKSRKMLKQQLQNLREDRKLELFSEAVRAIQEPAQKSAPHDDLETNDEVVAYTNYIRLTLSKFSARRFRKAKKCIGDILYQIEEGEDFENGVAPTHNPLERYSPSLSSNFGSAYQASQYSQGNYHMS